MRKIYNFEELIFFSKKDANEWVNHKVRVKLDNNETIEGVIEKYVIDNDSSRTIIDPQFNPVGIRLVGSNKQTRFSSIKTLEFLDL